jgi:NAD(P)-dependent dehydrogenase (short-subunit alcohol dehydrogenase family)
MKQNQKTQRMLVIGASGGIGRAVALSLEARGAQVTRLSRRADGLDITDEASVAQHLGALEGPFDGIFIATGGLTADGAGPEKALADISAAAMAAQFALNATGPTLVLRHAPRLLRRDRRAWVAALSARVGSIGDNRLGGWYGYRAAKAALNQIVHTAAIELARSHRQAVCVALHPGTVRTALTAAYLGRHPAVAPEAAAENLLAVLDGLGPTNSGGFFDWAGKPVAW